MREGKSDRAIVLVESECRVHRTYMGSVERGERNISLDNTERIAKALGLKVSELFVIAEVES